jgi:TPR repeat protein
MEGPDMGYVLVDENRSSGYEQIKPLSPPPTSAQAFGPETDPELNPGIAISLPTAVTLSNAMGSLEHFTDRDKLHWAQDVVRLLDRTVNMYKPDPKLPLQPPHQIVNLYPLITSAVTIVISMLECPVPSLSAAAYYLRANLLSTGNVPNELQLGMSKDARQAFKDFEKAARGGETRGWFRLARDYESCGELERAKSCYEKGSSKGDGECIYVSSILSSFLSCSRADRVYTVV